jgi:vacuolar-type H+-ATPase subunit C/Vma6
MGEYDYANARLRAMRTRLLERRTLIELASVARVEDLITRLAELDYRMEIESALARYSGARVVTEAVRLHLARRCGKIRLAGAVGSLQPASDIARAAGRRAAGTDARGDDTGW